MKTLFEVIARSHRILILDQVVICRLNVCPVLRQEIQMSTFFVVLIYDLRIRFSFFYRNTDCSWKTNNSSTLWQVFFRLQKKQFRRRRFKILNRNKSSSEWVSFSFRTYMFVVDCSFIHLSFSLLFFSWLFYSLVSHIRDNFLQHFTPIRKYFLSDKIIRKSFLLYEFN